MVVPGVRAAAGKAVGKAVSSHAVVPGVRAEAGKAGSSQSSLAKAVSQSLLGPRIFRHHWSIATGYVFDGARATFYARTGVSTRLFSLDTASCVWCSRFTTALREACMRAMLRAYERSMAF